eukprot:CAMPEP_0195636600 /NCGR_PEP_ID=MMETSP0815-20121206/23952_1 /TAXON_ID=97485 /ORGANISM="Prymnesium parvum, Strain Texoma1" /LENGTH=67 /DNA_ID=CAMNT_0040778713 /DNA_START=23 /DNA_END=226 /DNA_ORIENTATION=+
MAHMGAYKQQHRPAPKPMCQAKDSAARALVGNQKERPGSAPERERRIIDGGNRTVTLMFDSNQPPLS